MKFVWVKYLKVIIVYVVFFCYFAFIYLIMWNDEESKDV